MALLVKERVLVADEAGASDLENKGYGEREDKKLFLSPEEALYLNEKRQDFPIQDKDGIELGFEELMAYFMKIDKDFPLKYRAFKDLKDRGFCVKSGFKFGSHYRVYARGDKPGKGHAIWLVEVMPEKSKMDMIEMSRAIRLAQNVRKKMIYAVMDNDSDITYYRFDRITP